MININYDNFLLSYFGRIPASYCPTCHSAEYASWAVAMAEKNAAELEEMEKKTVKLNKEDTENVPVIAPETEVKPSKTNSK